MLQSTAKSKLKLAFTFSGEQYLTLMIEKLLLSEATLLPSRICAGETAGM